MGSGFTEIRHPAPNHETAQRRGRNRHADPGERSAGHEIVKHHFADW